MIASCLALAIAGTFGWLSAKWASHIGDSHIVTIGNKHALIEKVAPIVVSKNDDSAAKIAALSNELKELREEFARIKDTADRNSQALGHITDLMENQEQYPEYRQPDWAMPTSRTLRSDLEGRQ